MKLIVSLSILLISFQSFDCYGRLNFFDVDLLRYAVGDKRGNTMVSPASIRTTLAMLLQGAKNVTADEIRTALRLSSDENDQKMELAIYLNALQLNTTSTVLQSANGVFVSNKLPLKKDFESVLKRDFSSEITKMDFDNTKKSVDLMNEWVNQKTHGHIPTIVEPEQLAPNMKMILANALYFKGTWKYNFDAKNTHGECFYRSDVCEKVTMMELETLLPYVFVDDLQAHAVELPYEDGRYSMILLVPMERNGCEAMIRDLPFVKLSQIRNLMHSTEMVLTMPKFTVSYTGDMVEPLSKMHIKSLFSDNANLSGIFEASTASVNAFQHKIFMSVDEKGTVAAAVSSAVVVPLSFSGIDIKIDRPFVFFIRDNKFGIVLFEGKIEEPTAFVEPEKLKSPVAVFPLDHNVLVEPVKSTSSNAPATSTNAPAAPAANGPREVFTPIVFPRSNFDSQTPVTTSTTEKSKTVYEKFKNFFG